MEAFFRGSHTTNFFTCGFSRSYNQAAEVPSSNVTCKSPRSPSINCRIMLAFVSIRLSITIFPAPFITAIEMLSLCTSMPIYFTLSIYRVLLSGGVRAEHSKPYSKRGAPLYCVVLPECGNWRFSGFRHSHSQGHARMERKTGHLNPRQMTIVMFFDK